MLKAKVNTHVRTFLAVDVQIAPSVLRAASLSEHSEGLTVQAGSAPVEMERAQLAAPGCWHSTGIPHKSQHELLTKIFINAQVSTVLGSTATSYCNRLLLKSNFPNTGFQPSCLHIPGVCKMSDSV